MPATIKEIEQALRARFPAAELDLVDYAGDGDHYTLTIKDASFNGLPLIKQHRMVKESLSKLLAGQLHAITIKTLK